MVKVKWNSISRYGLGAVMAVTGALKLVVPSLQSPAEPNAPKDALVSALQHSGFIWPMMGILELAVGAALLANRYVPFALAALAPLSISILAFHLSSAPEGLVVGIPIVAANVYLMWRHRASYAPLLKSLSAEAS